MPAAAQKIAILPGVRSSLFPIDRHSQQAGDYLLLIKGYAACHDIGSVSGHDHPALAVAIPGTLFILFLRHTVSLLTGNGLDVHHRGNGADALHHPGEVFLIIDFDHKKAGSPFIGYYRVTQEDLNIMIEYWQVKEPPVGPGVPADCEPGNVDPEA